MINKKLDNITKLLEEIREIANEDYFQHLEKALIREGEENKKLRHRIELLHSTMEEIRKYIKENELEDAELVWRYKDGKYFEAGILDIMDRNSDKE